MDTVAAHHCVFGAKLLEKWRYADSYINCALNHENEAPDNDEEKEERLSQEILIVRFANMAAKFMGYSLEEKDYSGLDLENMESANHLKLNVKKISILKEKLTEEMEGVMELF